MVAGCLKVAFCIYLIISVVRAVLQWDSFTCSEPIQAWLVGHQLITLLLLLGHQLAHRIPGPSSSGALLPVHGNRLQKAVSYAILLALVPVFIASDIVGLVWFLMYSSENTRCWPTDVVNDPQVMALVLFGCCFWGFVYLLFGVSLVCRTSLGNRLSLLNPAERMERERRNRSLQRRQPNLDVPLQTLLQCCPEDTCDQDCDVDCSICQDKCLPNQKMRTIVVCGHQYHSECLEMWLNHRPVCPNCQQDVTTPVAV